MKTKIAGILVLVMLVLSTVPAFAVQAEYNNTKSFLEQLDSYNLNYTVVSRSEGDTDDHIQMDNKGDSCSYTFQFFFDENNSQANIRVWYLIYYNPDEQPNVLAALNKLNNDYKFGRWYADESDNSVTFGMDLILRENDDAGAIVMEAAIRTAQIIDDAYATLAPLSKAQ